MPPLTGRTFPHNCPSPHLCAILDCLSTHLYATLGRQGNLENLVSKCSDGGATLTCAVYVQDEISSNDYVLYHLDQFVDDMEVMPGLACACVHAWKDTCVGCACFQPKTRWCQARPFSCVEQSVAAMQGK